MDFSIIIPAYNTEALIGQCLDRVISQDYPKDRYEIIVVNDCSPDNLDSVVREKQRLAGNLRLLNNSRNRKQGGARNTGLEAAGGRNILFLDSDDLWLRADVLSFFSSVLEAAPYADFISASDYVAIGGSDRPLEPVSFPQTGQLRFSCVSGTEYLKDPHCFFGIWLCCYDRHFLLKNRLFFAEDVYFEDTDWRARCISLAGSICCTDFVFYGYRDNPVSVTKSYKGKLFVDNISALVRSSRWADENAGIIGADCQRVIKTRVAKNVISDVRYSRNFRLVDSRSAFRQVRLIRLGEAKISRAERMVFLIAAHFPSLLYVPVRLVCLAKRFVAKRTGD